MNLIFMRHGEATDNVKEIISDKEIYWSVLTEDGENVVKESVKAINLDVDKIYISPLPRTIQTAHFLSEKFPSVETIIDDRIKEIQYGKYSGKQNNSELDNTRKEQINGDYFIRFGDYGENKYEIEKRLCEFLMDVKNNNFSNNTIVIVSHGSITSYMKRILNLKSQHLSTGKIEVFLNVDFSYLREKIKELKNVKNKKISNRLSLLENVKVDKKLMKNLVKIAEDEFDNIEFSDKIFAKYIQGLTTTNIKLKSDAKFCDGVILICFYNNFENFVRVWMEHYISLGVKNFVMVDNDSTDDSTKILKEYSTRVSIAFWETKEKYDCNKMCGWKQQVFNYYGSGNIFLTVDSDELFAYEGYEKVSIEEFINKHKLKYVKSLMVDVYSDKQITKSKLDNFEYVDINTYKKTNNNSYGERFWGGPRARIFGVKPSLQKIPFIQYTGEQVFINDHFYYPWIINKRAKLKAYLFHYKFLPGDFEKYHTFALDGRHWNSSREYKIYDQILSKDSNKTFYSKFHSVVMKNFKLPQ